MKEPVTSSTWPNEVVIVPPNAIGFELTLTVPPWRKYGAGGKIGRFAPATEPVKLRNPLESSVSEPPNDCGMTIGRTSLPPTEIVLGAVKLKRMSRRNTPGIPL